MSFDGTFSVDSSIERLLYRHPNLRSDPKLVSLSLKGKDVTHVEVVEVLADLFLHPDYTVPVMGCFRPLARMIVERAIKKLQTVPSLDSQATDDGHGEEEIGESEFGVVNFYVGRGSGLRLHELACLALCRALDLAPFLLRMSCCGGNCGCVTSCKCGGCKMYADIAEEKMASSKTLVLGVAPQKGKVVEELKFAAGGENGGCKYGANCTCEFCNCK